MRNTTRFARGTGCYKWTVCGKLTRSTGRGDNENSRQCVECFDLGGLDNTLSDGGMTNDQIRNEIGDTFERRPELRELFPDLANL